MTSSSNVHIPPTVVTSTSWRFSCLLSMGFFCLQSWKRESKTHRIKLLSEGLEQSVGFRLWDDNYQISLCWCNMASLCWYGQWRLCNMVMNVLRPTGYACWWCSGTNSWKKALLAQTSLSLPHQTLIFLWVAPTLTADGLGSQNIQESIVSPSYKLLDNSELV